MGLILVSQLSRYAHVSQTGIWMVYAETAQTLTRV